MCLCAHVCAKSQTQVPSFLSFSLFIFPLLVTRSLLGSGTQCVWPHYHHSTYSATEWGQGRNRGEAFPGLHVPAPSSPATEGVDHQCAWGTSSSNVSWGSTDTILSGFLWRLGAKESWSKRSCKPRGLVNGNQGTRLPGMAVESVRGFGTLVIRWGESRCVEMAPKSSK